MAVFFVSKTKGQNIGKSANFIKLSEENHMKTFQLSLFLKERFHYRREYDSRN